MRPQFRHIFSVFLLAAIWSITSAAQVSTAPYTNPRIQLLNAAGLPVSGGLLYTYQSGTSTPKATYTDSAGVVPNSNPVVLDSAGMATVYFASGSYKLVLKTSGGVQLWSQDNVSSPSFASPLQNVTIDTAAGNVLKLNGNTLTAAGGTATITVPAVTDTLANLTSVQSLSNKTLVTPTISNPAFTGATVFQPIIDNNANELSGTNRSQVSTVWLIDNSGNAQFGKLTLTTGVAVDGAGFKHLNGAGCATAGTAGAFCDATLTFTTPFIDTNYDAVCGGTGQVQGIPVSGGIASKLAGSIAMRTVAVTAAVAQFTNITCIVVHN